MREASSKVSSRRKRRSGANFRFTRRATSVRSTDLCLARALMTGVSSPPPSGIT